ncbi:hypothetical protein V498_08684 [Pseudogymnoascus sp. VKM F-4517 (FW-2822)]|nr:hypothetical protein V498_08684 [Pseudogymnoascus sp. VKM F-4517 (FW-2822)]
MSKLGSVVGEKSPVEKDDFIESKTPSNKCSVDTKPATKDIFMTWKGFTNAITQAFSNIDAKRTAERTLSGLTQKGSAVSYTAQFQQYANQTDWNDEALKNQRSTIVTTSESLRKGDTNPPRLTVNQNRRVTSPSQWNLTPPSNKADDPATLTRSGNLRSDSASTATSPAIWLGIANSQRRGTADASLANSLMPPSKAKGEDLSPPECS